MNAWMAGGESPEWHEGRPKTGKEPVDSPLSLATDRSIHKHFMASTLGFHGQLEQPGVRTVADITLPRKVDFARLDRWLVGPIGLDDRSLEGCTQPPPGRPESHVARQFAQRALALYPELAQACGLPCFARGEIVRLERVGNGAGAWKLETVVPWIDLVPMKTASGLLKFSCGLLSRLAGLEPSTDNIIRIHGVIQTQLIDRARGLMPGGKSTLPVCKVAWVLGVPTRHLGQGMIQLGQASKARLTDRSACDRDSAIGARISTDKHATALLLEQAGLPAPEHRLVDKIEQARQAAAELGWPVVVKPANRDRGEGVSIDVRDDAALTAAFEAAIACGPRVLVERQAAGICHRLFVADGAIIFVTRRNPKSVRGNGRSTVRELVAEANAAQAMKPPWQRLKPFPLDALAEESLRRAGMSASSIPGEGVPAPLRPIESTEWGGETENMTEAIHPDNAAAAIDAAARVGLCVAGVDMITTDISVPWHRNGAIINEVNFAPFFGGKLDSPRTRGFIQRLVGNDGRIPLRAVLGPRDVAREIGQRMQAGQIGAGLRCWLTTSDRTDAPTREDYPLRCNGLFDRCIALLARQDVDALVLVIDDDALLTTGLPVDRFDRCYVLRAGKSGPGAALLDLVRARTAEGDCLEVDPAAPIGALLP